MTKNQVNKPLEVELRDGTVVEVRPLTIRQLRRFVKLADKFPADTSGELTDDALDAMVEACAVTLEKALPDVDAEYLEENLDIPTINKILGVAMGGEGNDPNLAKG